MSYGLLLSSSSNLTQHYIHSISNFEHLTYTRDLYINTIIYQVLEYVEYPTGSPGRLSRGDMSFKIAIL